MVRSMTLATSIAVLVMTSGVAMAAADVQAFIKSAIQGDNAEILLGQLAQQKGSTDQVRQYGEMLITDHTVAKKEALDVAKQINVSPMDTPKPEAVETSRKLTSLSGVNFDRAFLEAMIADHKKDIADYQEQADTKAGPASAMAAKQLPVLQNHLRMAQDLQGSQTGQGASPATPSKVADAGFLTREGSDLWRGSKLVGVDIYGPDSKKVGDINDVLLSKEGRATFVVVGVGGFLGIGEKNVAIPFEKVSFTQDPIVPTLATPAPASTGIAPGTTVGLGTAPQSNDAMVPTAAAPAPLTTAAAPLPRSEAYPDHGTVDFTADQLKSAPSFAYAR